MLTMFLIIIWLLWSCSSWLQAHSQFLYQFWAFTFLFHFSLLSYVFSLLIAWIYGLGFENSGKSYALHMFIPECLIIPSKQSCHWCWLSIMLWCLHDFGSHTQWSYTKNSGVTFSDLSLSLLFWMKDMLTQKIFNYCEEVWDAFSCKYVFLCQMEILCMSKILTMYYLFLRAWKPQFSWVHTSRWLL